jgi:hypothetical protein
MENKEEKGWFVKAQKWTQQLLSDKCFSFGILKYMYSDIYDHKL